MSQQNKTQEQVQQQESRMAVTDPKISRLNDKYASKITAGEISVTAQNDRSRLSPQEMYNSRMKTKKLSMAQKEKKSLEKKLDYLNKSIQSIQDYDYSTGRSVISPQSKSPPVDPLQIIKKNKEFHQKVKQDKRVISQKKRAEQKRHQQKIRQQLQQMKKKEEQQKAKKKQEILENMQKIKQRMQNREAQIRKRQEDYFKVVGGTTLFKKIQKEQALHESHVLEERKKKLANIRNLHKPVSIVEIEEHQKKFFEALKEKELLRQQQRRLNNAVEEYRVSYKSPRHRDYSLEMYHQETNESKIKADKMRQFSEHVRQNFAPQVDDKKREEIAKQMESEQEKKRRKEQKQEEARQQAEQIKNKGLRYLQELRQLPKRRNSTQSKISPNTERPHYTNYLTHSEHINKTKWSSILDSNVSRRDKAIRLQMEAERMEGTLKMKEQKARILKKDPDDVDQEYYEMVKAKLQLLQN